MSLPISVLVVEDSPSMQAALEALFTSIGNFEVIGRATSETRATDWLQRHSITWELLVTDLILQDGSGYGVIRRARTANSAGRIIVFSEFATPAVAQKCVEIGADAVFRKSDLKAFVGYLEGLANAPAPSMRSP